MLPIVLSSMIALTLIIERWRALSRKKIFPESFINEIHSLLDKGQIEAMWSLSKTHESPIARILADSLDVTDPQQMEEKMQQSGRKQAVVLEKNLEFLGVIASIAPLLGLLGTVTGMIQTFDVIKVIGVGDPLKLSGGIAEALLNTAGGLIVAIPAFVFQRLYYRRVENYVMEMEDFIQSVWMNCKKYL